MFLDNYHELLAILKRIGGGNLGKVNVILTELKNKVDKLLKEYDEDENGEIDIDELINEREKFNQELSKVEVIVEVMKKLEDEVVKYKKGSFGKEKTEEEISQTE